MGTTWSKNSNACVTSTKKLVAVRSRWFQVVVLNSPSDMSLVARDSLEPIISSCATNNFFVIDEHVVWLKIQKQYLCASPKKLLQMSIAKNSTFMGFHTSTKKLSPVELPVAYLIRCMGEYMRELVRVGNGVWVAPRIPATQTERVLLFQEIHTEYMEAQIRLISTSTGDMAVSFSRIVVSYIKPDPSCEHCDATVTNRCIAKNCNYGVHYSGPNHLLPCHVSRPLIPTPMMVDLMDDDKEDEDGNNDSGAVVEVKQTEKCVSCFANERLCYLCGKSYSQKHTVCCEYPGCKSVTHDDCDEFDDKWNALKATEMDKDDAVIYICELHASAETTGPIVVRCATCSVLELPHNELTTLLPPPENIDGKIARCYACKEACHITCRMFYMSCIQCQENSELCYHHDDDKVAICEDCYDATCSLCEEVGNEYPQTEKIVRCDACRSCYHDSCGGKHTKRTKGIKRVLCDDCLPVDAETDAEEDDAMRRKHLRRKRVQDIVPYILPSMYHLPLIESYFDGKISPDDFQEQLPKVLFFHYYVTWETFDKKAKVVHAKALAAGAALPPCHSGDDVEFLVMTHMARFKDVNLRPWEHFVSVADWRATVAMTD